MQMQLGNQICGMQVYIYAYMYVYLLILECVILNNGGLRCEEGAGCGMRGAVDDDGRQRVVQAIVLKDVAGPSGHIHYYGGTMQMYVGRLCVLTYEDPFGPHLPSTQVIPACLSSQLHILTYPSMLVASHVGGGTRNKLLLKRAPRQWLLKRVARAALGQGGGHGVGRRTGGVVPDHGARELDRTQQQHLLLSQQVYIIAPATRYSYNLASSFHVVTYLPFKT